jgi:hypothetical protein
MAVDLHPVSEAFSSELRALVPEPLSGFLAGLCAASAAVWEEGGLVIREVAKGGEITRMLGSASDDTLVQEFFACVCGNRSGQHTRRARIVQRCLVEAVREAVAACAVHLEVEVDEPSWCYELHIHASVAEQPNLYIRLYWSVD